MTENFRISSIEYALLRNIFLFNRLSTDRFNEICELCTWQNFKAGEAILWSNNDKILRPNNNAHKDSVFFLLSGRVRVHRFSLSGREITLDQIEAGGIFGELSAIDSEPRSADVIGVTAGIIAIMKSQDFRRVIQNDLAISFALHQYFVRIIRKTSDRVMTLTSMEAHARVFHTILLNCKTSTKSEVLILENLTHHDIACMSGCTRETVSRSIGTLIKLGMAKKKGRALHIHDKSAIKQLILKYST